MDLIEHRVRERAYYIWEDEGRVHGRADAHWLRAEAEIAAPAKAGTKAGILTVQPVAEASLAPSPARTLKPKAARTRAAAEAKPAKAVAKTAVAKTAGKTATKTMAPEITAPKAPKALAAGLAAKAKAPRPAAGLH